MGAKASAPLPAAATIARKMPFGRGRPEGGKKGEGGRGGGGGGGYGRTAVPFRPFDSNPR